MVRNKGELLAEVSQQLPKIENELRKGEKSLESVSEASANIGSTLGLKKSGKTSNLDAVRAVDELYGSLMEGDVSSYNESVRGRLNQVGSELGSLKKRINLYDPNALGQKPVRSSHENVGHYDLSYFLPIVSVFAGVSLLSFNMTGNVIGGFIGKTQNPLGILLLVLGIIGIFFNLRKRNKK